MKIEEIIKYWEERKRTKKEQKESEKEERETNMPLTIMFFIAKAIFILISGLLMLDIIHFPVMLYVAGMVWVVWGGYSLIAGLRIAIDFVMLK